MAEDRDAKPKNESHEQPKWREDFPIETAGENYVARRDFVKFMVLTSGAFVAGQFWIGLDALTSRGGGEAPRKAIAKIGDLEVGESLTFHYPDETDTCLLVRTEERTWRAYDQKCTHLACAVQPRPEEGKFHCPCHNGWFDMETGRALSGPPRRPLPKINLEIEDDTIYATGVELRT